MSYGCHPRGLDAVTRPSNKLLGVKTLMIESSVGFTPIGGSFIKLDTSLQTVIRETHAQTVLGYSLKNEWSTLPP